MRTREELEKSINDFPIKTSRRKFFDDIATKQSFFMLIIEYYRSYVYPRKPLVEYELPLMETAVACMKCYDKTKGEFLHLFNGEMKKAVRRAEAKERSDRMRQGLKLARDDERLIQKIIAFAVKRGLDVYDAATQRIISHALHVNPKDVQDAVFINDNAVVVPGTVKSHDGESADLLDLQADKAKSAEAMLEEQEAILEKITQIDRIFVSMRDSQKRVLSVFVTAKTIEALDYDIHRVEEVLQGKAVYSRELLAYYGEHGELPTQKQIGVICGLPEQSVSRTIKTFKEKLKSTL